MRKITSTDFISVQLYSIYTAAAAGAETDVTRRQTPDKTTHRPIREQTVSCCRQVTKCEVPPVPSSISHHFEFSF